MRTVLGGEPVSTDTRKRNTRTDYEACRTGCGRRVNNHSGICRECSTQPCSVCGARFLAYNSTVKTDRCAKHRSQAQANRYSGSVFLNFGAV